MGLSISPDTFQEKMSELMAGLEFACSYLDNLLILLTETGCHSNPWRKRYFPSNSFDNEDETKSVTYKTTAEETAFLQSILDKEENNQKEQASDNMDEKSN
jgi:hypothetical protein